MTKTPAKTYPTVTPALARVIETLTREQLYEVLRTVEGQSIPALARATDAALRSAVGTYIRMDRLKADVILSYLPKGGA